jgi:hypothetical protein
MGGPLCWPIASKLRDQIRAAYQTSLTRSYAHTLSITQSSGTGKSRLVDEFSKEHFVIPLNLRDSDGEFWSGSLLTVLC